MRTLGRSARIAVALAVALPLALSQAACAGAGGSPRWQAPPANARFDYQIGGAYPPAQGVRIVTRDRTDRPARGRYGICYVNGFQTQPSDRAWWRKRHPDLLLQRNGKPLVDPDWPDEYILDISTAAKRSAIARIERPWIDGCVASGYRAVELDNLDTYDRGYPRLTEAHALAFAGLLVARAHAKGLAVGQKNAAGLAGRGRTAAGFDFAVAEECQRYRECGVYARAYGARVLEIEYTDYSRRAYTTACAAQGKRISVILRDRRVVTPSSRAYRYRWC